MVPATLERGESPHSVRHPLACPNATENMMGTVRSICRNVKRWRNAATVLRWTAAGMLEVTLGSAD